MALVMGTLRDNEFITQLTMRLKKPRKRGYKSILDRFPTCPICRESQLAIGWDETFCAHCDNISNEDHTYECIAEEHERRENSWVLVLNSQSKNGPMKQREDYADAIRIKERDCTKNLKEQDQKSIPANKYGRERINCSQDTVKEPNELTRKPDGNGILLLPHQAHLRHGNHQINGGRHRAGMNFFLNKFQVAKCFACRQW